MALNLAQMEVEGQDVPCMREQFTGIRPVLLVNVNVNANNLVRETMSCFICTCQCTSLGMVTC